MAFKGSVGGWLNPKKLGGSPLKTVYDSAATQQADDYDSIMAGYKDFGERARTGSGGQGNLNFDPITARTQSNVTLNPAYSRGADFDKLVKDYQGYADTGGYSQDDISNIRERGISPIRSVYANAQRDMSRQKNLQGGRFANYGALASKMAREQADLLGGASTRVNADIAEMVAKGKLAALGGLNPLLSREESERNASARTNAGIERDVAMNNVEEQRRVDELNTANKLKVDTYNSQNAGQNQDRELSALQGQSNLYGTTPALTHEFGNQVLQNNAQNMQANQMANMIKNQRSNIGLNLVNNQLGQNRRVG